MERIRRMAPVVAVLVLAAAALLWLFPRGADAPSGLRVEVLSVGQGDCVLIRQGEHTMMIDSSTSAQREDVRAALRTRRIKKIDHLVLSHPHEDHVGNARMIIESYTVSRLLLSNVVDADTDQHLVTEAAERRGTSWRRGVDGERFALGEAEVEILYAPAGEDDNDGSMILRVTYGETAFLFTGDAEKAEEAALLAAVPAEKLQCDLLKAGHHGSENSTGEALLSAASPRYVPISCGKDNEYGFPHSAVTARLAARGIPVHRTDLLGDLVYESDGSIVTFIEED